MACAALVMGESASLSGSLTSLDCQVNAAVADGYGRLFGLGGAFGPVLTAVLTLFVAVLALGLISGRTKLTLSALTPRMLALGLVLTFATAWPAYQAVVYGLLTGGPDQIAAAFMGAPTSAHGGGATRAFAGRLDALFDGIVSAGQAVAATPKSPNLGVASNLLWTSAIALLLSTAGLLVVVRMVLAALLALGPIFVVFALFGATRGLFEGWLRTAVGFAFAPMLVVLGGSGLMAVLGPLIGAIGENPAAAVDSLRPIVTLFIAATVYVALVLTLVATAFALTRGWRLPSSSAGDTTESHTSASSSGAFAPAASLVSSPAERVSGLVTAVLREDSRAGSAARIETLTHALQTGAPAAAASSPTATRRAEGLGQSFRPAAPHRALAGSIGS